MTPEDEKELPSKRIAITERDSVGSPLSPTTTAVADLDLPKDLADTLLVRPWAPTPILGHTLTTMATPREIPG